MASCMVSLMRLTRRLLKPFPEKGTQKNRIFQRNESGIQAGTTPDENEQTLAVVPIESGMGQNQYSSSFCL